LESSVSNHSKFLDEFSKIQSDKTFDGIIQHNSNFHLDRGSLTHKPSDALINPKHQTLCYETQELRQILDKVDDILMLEGTQFQPNNTLFKINEMKWKNMEEELKELNLSQSLMDMMKAHITYNKAASLLLKVLKSNFPELAKTIFRILEGLNGIIEKQQK
jgi:hypothetical protein